MIMMLMVRDGWMDDDDDDDDDDDGDDGDDGDDDDDNVHLCNEENH